MKLNLKAFVKQSDTIKNDTYSMSLEDAIDEHKELVKFLKHPTKKEDKKELKDQGGELKEMLEAKKAGLGDVINCDWCGGGIKDTEEDPICVSEDGESTICIDCANNTFATREEREERIKKHQKMMEGIKDQLMDLEPLPEITDADKDFLKGMGIKGKLKPKMLKLKRG
jgi:hypothetical protein